MLLYSVQLFLKQTLKADYILSMFSYSPISKFSSSSVTATKIWACIGFIEDPCTRLDVVRFRAACLGTGLYSTCNLWASAHCCGPCQPSPGVCTMVCILFRLFHLLIKKACFASDCVLDVIRTCWSVYELAWFLTLLLFHSPAVITVVNQCSKLGWFNWLHVK